MKTALGLAAIAALWIWASRGVRYSRVFWADRPGDKLDRRHAASAGFGR